MTRKASIEVAGVNMLTERTYREKDMHCPLMSVPGKEDTPNYWKCQCKIRQKDPSLHRTCYPECQMKLKLTPDRNIVEVAEVIRYGKIWYKHHQQGMIQKDIADKYSTSTTTVSRYISIYLGSLGDGSSLQQKASIHAENAEAWYDLHFENNVAIKELARRFSTSPTTVRKYINGVIAQRESTQTK